jgi:hypothetical protein
MLARKCDGRKDKTDIAFTFRSDDFAVPQRSDFFVSLLQWWFLSLFCFLIPLKKLIRHIENRSALKSTVTAKKKCHYFCRVQALRNVLKILVSQIKFCTTIWVQIPYKVFVRLVGLAGKDIVIDLLTDSWSRRKSRF